MATRSERYRSDAERTGTPKRQSERKPPKRDWSHDKEHARTKATHALEATEGTRPSRVSTRSSANRAKSDAARNVTEEVRQGAPGPSAERARARAKRVRGARRREKGRADSIAHPDFRAELKRRRATV